MEIERFQFNFLKEVLYWKEIKLIFFRAKKEVQTLLFRAERGVSKLPFLEQRKGEWSESFLNIILSERWMRFKLHFSERRSGE